MMSSSNGASLDALRALGSINSAGIMPAAMQLAQRGAMGAYPAAMMQQQNMQQYLSHLPWMLRMQARAGHRASLDSCCTISTPCAKQGSIWQASRIVPRRTSCRWSAGPCSEVELPLAVQNTQGGMGNLFSSHLAGDAGAPEANVSGGLPLSEADGMPSLSGMSPSDAAAFLQSNKKASLVSARPQSCGWCTCL